MSKIKKHNGGAPFNRTRYSEIEIALCTRKTFGFVMDVEIYEYTPREIKKAITGSGAATKDQVQHMIINILNLDGAPAIDASDALAVAICHGHQSRIQGYLGTSKPLASSV